MDWNKKTISAVIDHTLLKANAKKDEIKKLCKEAIENGFASVCINPIHVRLVSDILDGYSVKTCTVIGFPLGANTIELKAEEASIAVCNGADELDMVINIGALKDKNYELVEDDILAVVEESDNAIIKVILETCYLDREEIITACEIAKTTGAHFIKTSTGFGNDGATIENIKLIRNTIGDDMMIKASGGIRTLEKTLAMLKAGADRIGASSGVSIISEIK